MCKGSPQLPTLFRALGDKIDRGPATIRLAGSAIRAFSPSALATGAEHARGLGQAQAPWQWRRLPTGRHLQSSSRLRFRDKIVPVLCFAVLCSFQVVFILDFLLSLAPLLQLEVSTPPAS
ncbi:hypothetical protein MN608_08232 [Microdochium nivale]|nr:hypothetical protein MN608_08232 [Microdochium nivale]